jgi:hypothetical protein
VLLGERLDAFSRLIAQEGGKPLTDAGIEAIYCRRRRDLGSEPSAQVDRPSSRASIDQAQLDYLPSEARSATGSGEGSSFVIDSCNMIGL